MIERNEEQKAAIDSTKVSDAAADVDGLGLGDVLGAVLAVVDPQAPAATMTTTIAIAWNGRWCIAHSGDGTPGFPGHR
jgi:hypothetical protein